MHRYKLHNDPIQFLVGMFGFKSEYISPDSVSTALCHLKHYMDFIKLYGTTDNYSTEYTECLHIGFTKDAYHTTNKQDEYPQMTMWLKHKEKLWHHAMYIQWRLDGETNVSQQLEKETPPHLSLTKHPSHKGVSILQLIDDYGAANFSDASTQFWVNLM